MRFSHRLFTLLSAVTLLLAAALPARAADTPDPQTVTLPGTLQSELGCSGDWQPDCAKTALQRDPSGIWTGAFEVQPQNDQDKKGPRYKVALNGNWGENYGAHAQRGGADIPLVVTAPTQVRFYYDHETHWVADSVNAAIVTAAGDFQTQLGCAKNNDPACLRSWLEDPDGDGVYTLTTRQLKAGTYQVQAAVDQKTLVGAPAAFTVKADGAEVYFGYNAAQQSLLVSAEGAPRGSLTTARAQWVNRQSILWNVVGSPKYTYRLHYDPAGAMTLAATGVQGGQAVSLTWSKAGPGGTVFQQNPYLAGYTTLQVAAADFPKIPEMLQGQLIVAAYDAAGKLVDATRVQFPGVLDDVYHYAGPLGVTWESGVPTLRIWAPTAQAVGLKLFADSKTVVSQTVPLTRDPATGVWSVTGAADWQNQFYLYEVKVFVPDLGQTVTNLVTDPYSFSLSTNGTRSQIVDLNDPALKPDGWDTVQKPPLAAPEDSVIYELHIRDFSASDPSVPAGLRGTYAAFTLPDSNGVKHLKALAQAGLTHLHLLPAFDIASINEDKSTWQGPDDKALAALPGDSDQQPAAVKAVEDKDAFNWGYDPVHYTVPDGAYALEPDGAARIKEFRAMVQALNKLGLRVVMDVVYNHTNASGQNPNSVLDKIVPGYYYRLNADGRVETSTCCQNTATEHRMMEKLMVDSVLTWATAYKVDGFRFDLMGHHLLSNMNDVRAALDALTPAAAGVDGQAVYLYGEGWDFGEVAHNARGVNASQLNIGGSGIGVFNDRLRDAARGGSPFTDRRVQGFITGLFGDPNGFEQGLPDAQRADLLHAADLIRLGLAGNLKDYPLQDALGRTLFGADLQYNGQPAGYTLDPQENVVYVSAHDNETLFDAIQWKAPLTETLADRVRMNNLGVDLVLLSQGVPFFHAGDDLLRSKSLDGNSYNSGDWFNKLDLTYQTNNWAVGLPPNAGDRRDLMKPLLADPALKAAPADIAAAHAHFLEMLAIRKSSPLFRLRTAAEVEQRLTFANTGPDQVPGLIVFRLDDTQGADLDPAVQRLEVLINANPQAVTFTDKDAAGQAFVLHPLQVAPGAAFDKAAGAFTVPGRTTVIFVVKQAAATPAPTATNAPAPAATAAPAATTAPAPAAPLTANAGWLAVIVVAGLLTAYWVLRRRS